MDFPQRKDHLYKFGKPKHYTPKHAYFSFTSKNMVKLEIKVWFTSIFIINYLFSLTFFFLNIMYFYNFKSTLNRKMETC